MAATTSLILLASQNFAYGILLPKCREADEQGHTFFPPSTVLMMELTKLAISVVVISGQQMKRKMNKNEEIDANQSAYNLLPSTPNTSFSDDEKDRASDVGCEDERSTTIASRSDVLFSAYAFRMAVPALLYVVQNNLQVLSAGYLSAVEFQVFSQFKIVFTAIFSVLLLQKRLSRIQGISIAVLFLGAVMVQLSSFYSTKGTVVSMLTRSATDGPLFGVIAILTACMCSGLAGTLIELQLKQKTEFWVTNVHLSLFSMIPAIVPIFIDSFIQHRFDPLRYFNLLTWTMIMLNVIGGLLVALVLKLSDNIAKGFAVCASLILTVFYNSWSTGHGINFLQFVGTTCVALSTYSYIKSPKIT